MRGRRRGIGSYTLGDQYISPDRRMSQMLMEGSTRKGKPAHHYSDTLGRIAQQLAGGYLAGRDQKNQNVANQAFAKVQPDSFRPPTDAEAMAAPGMRDLELAAMSGMAGDGQGQTVTAPLPDDQLMGQGNIPDIMEKIGRYNQNMGEPGALGDEILQQGLDLQSQKFNQEMNQSREASNVPRPRDFKAELAQGMQGYQQDPNNRIMNEKKPQLEYAMQNLRGLENNPYAQRLLQGLMVNQMDTNAASRLAGTARDQKLADIQSGRDYTSSENQLNRQGKIDAVSAKPPVPGRDTPYSQDVADQLANIAGAKEKAKKPTPDEIRNTAKIKEEVKQEAKVTGMQPKAKASLDSYSSKMDFVTGTIDSALDNVSNWSAQYGSLLSALPGSDANTLKNELQTIKANIGFQALQEMRANSPTGGALGNVANQELEALQATIGSLDQSQDTDVLRKNLTTLKAQLKSSAMRMNDAYAQTYGGGEGQNRRSTDKKERRSTDIPEGVSKEQWGVMSPEQKALFK